MLFAFALVATPRATLAADDFACAKYAEPLAYNACLASHGPKANIGAHSGGEGEPDAPPGANGEPSGGRSRLAARNAPPRTGPHGVHVK